MPGKTPLFECHVKSGAKLVEFAGWSLPVQFSGIIKEHNAVRNRAGVFDIGHMGLIEIKDLSAIQRLTTNDASALEQGQAQYSFMCDKNGGIIDDLLIYRIAGTYLIVSNAVNAKSVLENLQRTAQAKLLYGTMTSMALQGPGSESILQSVTEENLSALKHRRIIRAEIIKSGCLISRSGYTGEDGFELFLSAEDAPKIWRALIDAGALPCGLGSRDTLRIEAALPLYGHEIDMDTTPVEAGYSKTVKFSKGDFIGRKALFEQQEKGASKILIGFEVPERAVPRQGYKLFSNGAQCGTVTSGTFSPSLNRPIGMAYIKKETAGLDVHELEIRGAFYKIQVVPLPFYRRKIL